MIKEGLINITDLYYTLKLYNEKIIDDILVFILPELKENHSELLEILLENLSDLEEEEENELNEIIETIKKKKENYYNWIRNSNDFNDPLYREIEDDQLILSIKTDDIDKFQKHLSNKNINVDSKVSESIFENTGKYSNNRSLLSYATEYSSIKIIKYLIMNNAKFVEDDVFRAIRQRNLEVIHLVESNVPDLFSKFLFLRSISCWYEEITEYANTNYPLKLLSYDDDADFDEDDGYNYYTMINYTMVSNNFIFFDNYLLPFLKKHPMIVSESIYEIISTSINDRSCYFLKELLKYPRIDINYRFESNNGSTLLLEAIKERNEKAIEILLQIPNININYVDYSGYSTFTTVLDYHLSLRIVKMFCENPALNIQKEIASRDPLNFYRLLVLYDSNILEYFLCRFPELADDPIIFSTYDEILSKNLLNNLAILIDHQLIKSTKEKIIDDYIAKTGHKKDDSNVLTLIEFLS